MLSSPAQPNSDPLDVLQRVFGYASFRGPQEGIVRHVIGGGSGLVLMPTGGGKSLCYQVPACLLYTSPSPRDQRGSRMPSSA